MNAENDSHPYNDQIHFERVTPISDIPVEFRHVVVLPGGEQQILDRRLCYNWDPSIEAMVECSSVWSDADR